MYERGGYTLEDFTDCYKEEFMKNSDWISYGYHCYTDDSNYNDATYEQIKKEYQNQSRKAQKHQNNHRNFHETDLAPFEIITITLNFIAFREFFNLF